MALATYAEIYRAVMGDDETVECENRCGNSEQYCRDYGVCIRCKSCGELGQCEDHGDGEPDNEFRAEDLHIEEGMDESRGLDS